MCFCRYITEATRLYLYRFLSRRKMGTVSVRPSSLPPLPRALIIYAIALRPPGTHLAPAPHDLVILPRARDQTDHRGDQWHRRQCCDQKPFHDHSSFGGSDGCWSHSNNSHPPHPPNLQNSHCKIEQRNPSNSLSLIARMRSALVCLRFRSSNTPQRYAPLSFTVLWLGHTLADASEINLPSFHIRQALSWMQSAHVFAGCFCFFAIIILLSAAEATASNA